MKTILPAIAFGILLLALSSCRKPQVESAGEGEESSSVIETVTDFLEKKETPQLPMVRTLVDAEGRNLRARILAKSQGFLAVKRLEDEKYFSIAIGDLGQEDREFFTSLPDSPEKDIEEFRRLQAGLGERAARWNLSLSSAEFEAAKFDLPIYLLFTGSTWCPPCQALERIVLSSAEFQEFANSDLVLCKVDVPRPGGSLTSSNSLTRQFEVNSYPTVVLLDARGKEIGRFAGYGNTEPAAYVKKLESRIGTAR